MYRTKYNMPIIQQKKTMQSMHAKLEFITIKGNFEGKCQLTIEDKYFRCTICLVFGSVK